MSGAVHPCLARTTAWTRCQESLLGDGLGQVLELGRGVVVGDEHG